MTITIPTAEQCRKYSIYACLHIVPSLNYNRNTLPHKLSLCICHYPCSNHIVIRFKHILVVINSFTFRYKNLKNIYGTPLWHFWHMIEFSVQVQSDRECIFFFFYPIQENISLSSTACTLQCSSLQPLFNKANTCLVILWLYDCNTTATITYENKTFNSMIHSSASRQS